MDLVYVRVFDGINKGGFLSSRKLGTYTIQLAACLCGEAVLLYGLCGNIGFGGRLI